MTYQPIIGLLVFLLISYVMSNNKKNIVWSQIVIGFVFVFVLAGLLTHVKFLSDALSFLNHGVMLLDNATMHATSFLFGYLGGGATPFEIKDSAANFIIAFRVLPLIIVVSALFSLLFYLKIIPFIIKGLSKVFEKIFSLSSPLGFGASSTIFLGTIEAPLIIKPYLKKLSDAELQALLSCSMATVSGSVMILYASVLSTVTSEPLTQMITASVISVPIALIFSLIISPIKKMSHIDPLKSVDVDDPKNFMEAILRGTFDGLQMVFSIVAVLLVLFAFVFLINTGLSVFGPQISLQYIMGLALRPVLWLTGISWAESGMASELMATKIIINEFVAFLDLAKLQTTFSEPSKVILLYCLCGFANLGSLGIITGGLSKVFAGSATNIYKICWKALFIGNVASLSTGCVIAILIL